MASLDDTLDDLAVLIARVEESTKNRTYQELIANAEAYDALVYRLAMIGETSKKLPDEVRERHSHLPWRDMAGFRNFASHDYFGIDAKLVWAAAMDLEPIKTMMREERLRLDLDRARSDRDRDGGPER